MSVKLPKKVTFGQATAPDGTVLAEFLHWPVTLPGGIVNMFVHTADKSLAGTTVRLRVEVKIKTADEGRKFIFVDLHPVDMAIRPTHRLCVIQDIYEQMPDWLVFPAPGMQGIVALIGPDEKLVQSYMNREGRQAAETSIEASGPFAEALKHIAA